MSNEEKEPEQLVLMRRLVELSKKRTEMSAERSRMSAERSEMSAERSYMNAERTLSVWVRTALALMIFGIAIDRFGLFLDQLPGAATSARVYSDELSHWLGIALTGLGVSMALATGVRFLIYAASYRRRHRLPLHHGPYLAPFFALMVALFGIVVLIVLAVVRP